MPHHDPRPDPEQLSSDRLEAIHVHHMAPEELAGSLGTAEEWRGTAMSHVKAQLSGGQDGTVRVSVAALHILLMRLEELDHEGEAWQPAPG